MKSTVKFFLFESHIITVILNEKLGIVKTCELGETSYRNTLFILLRSFE